MKYEPVKNSLGKFFSRSPLMRKMLYLLLDMLLLRTWHVRKALRRISKEFRGEANILDAGSGLGQYSWRMSRMNRKWHISGIDINKDQVDECTMFFTHEGLNDRVSFRTGDLVELSEQNCYDLILSVDVMEHIKDDTGVFRNFHRSLRENGVVLISTPSDKGGSDVHDHEGESFIDEHVREGYSPEEIISKLSMAGFRNTEVRYTYGKPGNISWRLSMKYPIIMLNKSYLFFIILPFYYLIFFPVSLILNIFDLHINHSSGTGLLVTARK